MYLDPGFGGMILQIIVAIIATGGAVLFSFRRKIKSMFSKGDAESVAAPSKLRQDDLSDDVVDTLADDEPSKE